MKGKQLGFKLIVFFFQSGKRKLSFDFKISFTFENVELRMVEFEPIINVLSISLK